MDDHLPLGTLTEPHRASQSLTEGIARREAREEVEKRLAVVKAYDDIAENN